MDFDSRTDRVPVAIASLESEAQKVPTGRRQVVFREAEPRAGAILKPDIKISVAIPVGRRHCPSVVEKVQTACGRHRRKPRSLYVEKYALALMAVE